MAPGAEDSFQGLNGSSKEFYTRKVQGSGPEEEKNNWPAWLCPGRDPDSNGDQQLVREE